MGIYLLQPNSKPSFAHTQRWGLNDWVKAYDPALILALNEGGGNNVVDANGSGHTGAFGTIGANLGPKWTSGGLDFEVFDVQYIENTTLPKLTDNFTIIARVKLESQTAVSTALCSSRSGTNSGWAFKMEQYNATSQLGITFFGVADYSSALSTPTDGVWADVALRCSGSTITLVKDGESDDLSVGSLIQPTLNGLALGAVHRNGAVSSSDALDGKVAYFYSFNQLMPLGVINVIHANPNIVFNKGFDLSRYGGVAVSGFQPAWAQNSTLTQGIPGVV